MGTATGDPSAWYCPWVAAGALRDSAFNLASMVDVGAAITLPNPNPTEEPDGREIRLRGPGARSMDAGAIVRRGASPGVVEFDDGPAVATTAMWSDELLTGDRCVVSVPKVWHLVGGITAEGFKLELQLFNPFAESAKVRVEAITEFGSSPLAGFENIDIPGRSWVTEDLSRVIPFLDNASFTVTSESGIVIPSLVLNNGTDEASWPGTGQSTTWDFPVTSVRGLVPTLVLSKTGSTGATVAIDLFTPDGPILDADGRIVSPLEPVRINLADLAEPPFAVRVRSNVPVGAVIQAGPEGTFPSTDVVLPEDDDGGCHGRGGARRRIPLAKSRRRRPPSPKTRTSESERRVRAKRRGTGVLRRTCGDAGQRRTARAVARTRPRNRAGGGHVGLDTESHG